jgi:LysR family hydrogen peroxide-inducible transcriptional activator
MAEPPDGAGLASAFLFEDRFLLAGSQARIASLGRGPEVLRPRALDPGQLLLLDEGHCLADQALEVCGLNRRQTRVDLGASSLATLAGLVAEGFGLTFLPEIALRTEAASSPTMGVTRFAAPEPFRRVALVRRASSADENWFSELAQVLADAGHDLLAHARAAILPSTPNRDLDKPAVMHYVKGKEAPT